MGVGNGVAAISTALRRTPRSLVEVEVGAVVVVPDGVGVLAQLLYDRVDFSPQVRTTLVAVHHSEHEIPAPATYERVHPGAALLDPSEVDRGFPRGRGLRWVSPADPGGRAWSTGLRLVRLVDDAATGGLLAGHFGVPLHLGPPTA